MHAAGLPVAVVVFGHLMTLARPLMKMKGVPETAAVIVQENPDALPEQSLPGQADLIVPDAVKALLAF